MAQCVHTDLHHRKVESSNLTVNKTSPSQILMTPRSLERHINHSHLCHKALTLRNHQRNGRVSQEKQWDREGDRKTETWERQICLRQIESWETKASGSNKHKMNL